MKIQLIYDADCPNAEAARRLIIDATKNIRKDGIQYAEYSRQDPSAPAHVLEYGSPTILVEGVDVYDPPTAKTGDSCRLYRDEHGRAAVVPPVSALRRALGSRADGISGRIGSRTPVVASLGTLGLAALPALSCPGCWPAYAAALGALGLGFLNYTPYLTPALLVLAQLSLAAVWWQSRRKRSYLPFAVAAVGVLALFLDRLVLQTAAVQYTGLGLLLSGSVWSAWRPRSQAPACEC